MSKLKLSSFKSKKQYQVRTELESALAADYDNVIIFGFKSGAITSHGTRLNRLEFIGALEAAKQQLWGYPCAED